MRRKKDNWARRFYTEFAQFYTEQRCPWAPECPRRVFEFACQPIYTKFCDRMTEEQFLSAVYATLGFRGADPPGLFQTFHPTKYAGSRPLEEHFLSLFARKLSGKLTSLLRRTTDNGRPGDRTKFQMNPALGLLHGEAQPGSERAQLHDLPAVLDCLDARERAVVHLLYWADLSARKVGAVLGMDHKTVARVHESALAKLRRLYGLEENLAA